MKYIYTFAEGNGAQKQLLGGKGANLAEMTQMGIPVPPGFTISTQACEQYLEQRHLPEDLWEQVLESVDELQRQTGKVFGGSSNPLLVSVRSGAPISMPGMMDTILNLGLNDQSVQALIALTNNPRFAYDSYRRFIQMYANVVLGLPVSRFEKFLQQRKEERGLTLDTELTAEDWQAVIVHYQQLVHDETGHPFPQDPLRQLKGSVRAVFESWLNPRAITYRKIHQIPDHPGTAVNIQTMVFGNTGNNSATGVAFTRNPGTGENAFFGEFLFNAQGEDVVAGIRTPEPVVKLQEQMPEAYEQLLGYAKQLERHFGDMQDLEFTIEEGTLYMLQTRKGKRTATAALRIAVEMVEEGLIDRKEAVMRIDPATLDQVLHPRLAHDAVRNTLTRGLAASPGAAVGKLTFTANDAERLGKAGEDVILVRHETSPEDIHGMYASRGVLTACGGMTSHAAVVARGMGIPCVSGATAVVVDEEKRSAKIGDLELREGDLLTIDGGTGEVILGSCPTEPATLEGPLQTILQWADEFSQMQVRANADTPQDATKSREFGAVGIGLCRTEHMFFEPKRIMAMREMILADTVEEREVALKKLEPYQQADFVGIFQAMNGLPVTIRLLDPPLHEFLPTGREEIQQLAADLGKSVDQVRQRVAALSEVNPMLGHRGCRLMLTYPEVARMQARAIIGAALQVQREGIRVIPEIMIPLVGSVRELRALRQEILKVHHDYLVSTRDKLEIRIGTMIELPRACMLASEIAEEADFFSFGTNDLTQMTYGYSRDDAAKFLSYYLDHGYLPQDPFQILDTKGVGQLIALAAKSGRDVKKHLKIGICGEHGGEPHSIDFCFVQGFNYVSCSPFRVPIARLASAQSSIRHERA